MSDPTHIFAWRRLSDTLTTSGQPSEEGLAIIRALGVEHIVNLGLHTHEKALPDEAVTVAELDMTYTHIPVEFDAPTEEDFTRFRQVMDKMGDTPVHVHCIVNARVSAFLYRYRRYVLDMDEGEARAAMETVWRPGGCVGGLHRRRGGDRASTSTACHRGGGVEDECLKAATARLSDRRDLDGQSGDGHVVARRL